MIVRAAETIAWVALVSLRRTSFIERQGEFL